MPHPNPQARVAEPGEIADNLTYDPRGFWTVGTGRSVSCPDWWHDFHLGFEDTSFWFRHRNRVITAAVRTFPLSGGPLADVGGGNGYVAAGLERAGIPTVLIEPSQAGVLNACRRGLRAVVCATAEEAGVRDGCLGGVGLFDVVEHTADDVGFLAALRRTLAPGGRVYVTVPAFQNLWSAEDERLGHFRRYTLRTLTGAVTRAGFRVEYATYFFWLLPLPVFLMRTLPTRLGLRRSFAPGLFRREHVDYTGVVGRAVERVLAAELRTIARKGRVPCGGSCLVVGRRTEPG